MHRGAGFFAGVAALVLCLASFAQAAPLATDPNAMLGWKGTQPYSATVFTFTLKANVEYAVYAPGNFNLSFPSQDPSGGTQYVYAYEIFNDQGGNRSILNFTVGFSGGNELPAGIGHTSVGLTGSPIAPSSSLFIPAGTPKASAKWDFSASSPLFTSGVGKKSNILFYTSPYGPELDWGTLQGSAGVGQQQLLPSPVPEPASLLLAAIAAGSVMLFRVVRRRTPA